MLASIFGSCLAGGEFLGMLTSPSWFAGRKAEFTLHCFFFLYTTVMKIVIRLLPFLSVLVFAKLNNVQEFRLLGC